MAEFAEGRATLHAGDCLDVLDTLDANSIDAVVCDPPYGLAFMGKGWDSPDNVAFRPETWAKVLRVMKPGAHLVAFGGTRTYHRLVCAIEDAGFEVRDQIFWVFSTGFPKSLDVSKGIDKAAGAERDMVGVAGRSGSIRSCMAGNFAGGEYMATAPATDLAKQWSGFGTALKPAHEPICLARKPLIGTTVENVLAHGTGALNIDGCRIPGAKPDTTRGVSARASSMVGTLGAQGRIEDDGRGRWPANICHDGSDEVLELFPETGAAKSSNRGLQNSGRHGGIADIGRNIKAGTDSVRGHNDAGGSAARFFYCSKASKADRAGSSHPTVKPQALMRWLCRLVTPPGGVILDPFAGSGSTLLAALEEGFRAIGIEKEPEYVADASRRISGFSRLDLRA